MAQDTTITPKKSAAKKKPKTPQVPAMAGMTPLGFKGPKKSVSTKTYYCPRLPGEELSRECDCDVCWGACNNGNGGKCGDCFACEAIADDEKWWEINRADILGI